MPGKSTVIRFLLSDALSLLGNSVAAVVLPLLVLARTGDPLAAGTLSLACAIPSALFGVIGGVVLDRVNRRIVSIVSDCISALSVVLLIVVDLTVGLNLVWFIVLGIFGAIGDIPGMTARETISPDVAKHDDFDLQRFIGIEQSLQSLSVVIGPTIAAVLLGIVGSTLSLGVTAFLSFTAALITLTLSKKIGVVSKEKVQDEEGAPLEKEHPLRDAGRSLLEGVKLLLWRDKVLAVGFILVLGITMILGSFQGMVFPVFFTELNQPELLGYVLSALSFGILVGSIVYSALASNVRRHTWYVISFVGMAIGVAIMGLLPTYPLLLVGAAFTGAASGPVSALIGLLFMERLPEEKRGSALGTQNSILLLISPAAIFLTSVLVTNLGVQIASFVLIGAWILVTIFALVSKTMRQLDTPEQEQEQSAQ